MSDGSTPPVSGREVNSAARATRALLDRLLREERLAFPTWAVINLIGTAGRPLARAGIVDALAEGIDMPRESLSGLVDGIAAEGLIRFEGATADLTAEGADRLRRMRARVTATGAELWSGFSAGDLEATARVLSGVTERALAMAAR